MFEKIQVKNFQRHERLRIRFDPEITAVTGPSDAGKSSVLRAVRWLAANRPRGEGFVRDGERSASVKLLVDGKTVERRRDGARNEYVLDGKVFKAFGNDVPPQVAELLNLGEENFQNQHDPPFWFCSTAGEVARQLNKIVDLDVIDAAMSNIASELRRADAEVGVVEQRLAEAEAERDRLAFVPGLDEALAGLEEQSKEARRKAAWAARAGDLAAGAVAAGERVETLRAARSACSAVVKRGREAHRLADEAETLSGLAREAGRVREAAGRKVPDVAMLDRSMKIASDKAEAARRLAVLAEQASICEDKLEVVAAKLAGVQSTLAKELKGRCPLCGGPMKTP